MASSSSLKNSEDQLIEAADGLMPHNSADELVNQLDKLEKLLSMVPQAPCSSMRNALAPVTAAFISNHLFRHADFSVRVSVLSCITELSRITAPDSPYHDGKMKEVFQFTVTVLEKLSEMSGHCYKKAVQILNIVSKVRSSLLMQDLECDDLIVRMFKLFLDVIRYDHPSDVFLNMVSIMTLIIEESDEISYQLLSPILTSVQKENQKVSRILGEKVLKNCSAVLKSHLPQIVKSKGLDLNEYSEIVHFICRGETPKEQKIVEEVELEPEPEPVPLRRRKLAPARRRKPAPAPGPEPRTPAPELASEPAKPAPGLASEPEKPAPEPEKPAPEPEKPASEPALEPAKPVYEPASEPARPAVEPAKPSPEPAIPAPELAAELGPRKDVACTEEPVSSVNEQLKAVKNSGTKSSKKKKQNLLPENDFERKVRERRPNHRLNSEEGYDDFWFQNTRKITSPRNSTVKKDNEHRSNSQKQESIVQTENNETQKAKVVQTENNETQKAKIVQTENNDTQKADEICNKSDTKESGNKELVSPAVNLDGTLPNEPSKRKHKRKRTPAKSQDSVIVCGIKEYGQELVGRRIKVWWPLDKVFYEGCIASFDPSEKKHTVLYVDDEQEVLDLNVERWELALESSEEAKNSKTPAASQKPRSKKMKTKSDSSAKRTKIKPSKSASFSAPDSVIVINDDEDEGMLEGNSHKNASGELGSKENFGETDMNKLQNRVEA